MRAITIFVVFVVAAVGALLAAMGGLGVALAFWTAAAALVAWAAKPGAAPASAPSRHADDSHVLITTGATFRGGP